MLPKGLLSAPNTASRELRKTLSIISMKVLAAFIENRVSESHFTETTGYGYGDRGREYADKVFCERVRR